MHEIYFDNCATTKVSREAKEAAVCAMEECYGNPSSLHGMGAQASRLLAEARRKIAAAVKAREEEIYFTSCATEANNMALFGVARANLRQGKRILVSAVEHPSVIEPAKQLLQLGFDVRFLPVDQAGRVDMDFFETVLTDDVILTSVQLVNNETGTIQPVEKIGRLIKEKAPKACFHIDMVQGLGKLAIEPARWQADILTASGHKLHAPKGTGFFWLNPGCRLLPLLYGGGQEKNLRSGTENVPGICAMGVAVELAERERGENVNRMLAVKNALWGELSGRIGDCHCNSPQDGAPHILNVSFPGIRSEMLMHYLEQAEIYVSSGSACSSHKDQKGHVLGAMGLPDALIDSAIRFSFCAQNTVEEAKAAAQVTAESLAEIRALTGFRSPRR